MVRPLEVLETSSLGSGCDDL